jgi:hypothetical protein
MTKLVRDRTGGSFSTITPHLAAWKDERGGRAVANIPDMPDGVAGAARAMWAAAWNAAQEAVKTERDGLSAARREMDKERAELAQEIGELESKLDVAETERGKLAQALAEEEKRHRPSLTLPSNTPGRKRRSARVSAERRERPCIYARWGPQLRSRIGAGGLILRSFNRLEAASEGSVTCQMVPVGLDNCAS